mgnify:CR=1 FL=1
MPALAVGDGNHRHSDSSKIISIIIIIIINKIKISSRSRISMDFDSGIPISRASVVAEGSSSLDQGTVHPLSALPLLPFPISKENLRKISELYDLHFLRGAIMREFAIFLGFASFFLFPFRFIVSA